MNTIDDLIEIQMEYSENHPDDNFQFLDYFHVFSIDELIDIFNQSKGKKIRIDYDPTSIDRFEIFYC